MTFKKVSVISELTVLHLLIWRRFRREVPALVEETLDCARACQLGEAAPSEG